VLLSVWIASIVGLFALPKKRRKKKAASSPKKASKPKPKGLHGLIRLLTPYLFSRHGAYLLVYVVSLCTRILITIKIATTAGVLTSFMSTRNWNKMFTTQAKFGCLCFLASFNTAAMKFLEKRCALSVRDILFQYLANKLAADDSTVYYHLTLKDFPARISEELSRFSTRSIHTLGHLLKPSIDVLILSAQLAKNIGALPLAVYYGFFYFAQWSLSRFKSRALPVPLRECTETSLTLENQLHMRATQLEEKREQVALLGATKRERDGLLQDWHTLKQHLVMQHGQNFFVDMVSNYVLKYGGAMCAYSILIPGVYLGDAAATESSVTAHYMTQTSLLISLANAVMDLNGAGNEMPRVRGLASRVWGFNAKMDECLAWMKAHKSPVNTNVSNDVIRLTNVTVVPPIVTTDPIPEGGANDPLYRDVNIEIRVGTHTVVQGENGAGKTSMFRTMRGLWPPAQLDDQPSPVIEIPADSYFMPQDSIFGTGTLKDEILYPDTDALLSDDEARELLVEVGLSQFKDSVRSRSSTLLLVRLPRLPLFKQCTANQTYLATSLG